LKPFLGKYCEEGQKCAKNNKCYHTILVSN
jgi:hypothetical protein